METCPRCGEEVGSDARFCMNCGVALHESQQRTPEETDDARPLDDDDTDQSIPVGDATQLVDVSLRSCAQCGAANASRRSRCGRCGAPLEDAGPAEQTAVVRATPPVTPPQEEASSELTPTPPAPRRVAVVPTVPPLPEEDEEETEPPSRGRLAALLVVGLGVLLGGALGVAAATGTWPFESAAPDLPPFVAAQYAGVPDVVRPDFAGASSTRPAQDGRSFGAELTADGDPTTAWISADEGQGARLRHTFERPVWIIGIRLRNGDGAEGQFDAHGRVGRAEVDLGHGQRVAITFLDQPGEQLVTLPRARITDEVTWEITSVTGGTDVAVSEVVYEGFVANEADAGAYPD